MGQVERQRGGKVGKEIRKEKRKGQLPPKSYLFIPGATPMLPCAITFLMPFKATILALAMGSIISSAANLSRSGEGKTKGAGHMGQCSILCLLLLTTP